MNEAGRGDVFFWGGGRGKGTMDKHCLVLIHWFFSKLSAFSDTVPYRYGTYILVCLLVDSHRPKEGAVREWIV